MINERTQQIYNLVSDYLASGRDLLVSTQRLLFEIMEIASGVSPEDTKEKEEMNEEIIISCDASIKKNPGGPASVGVVIRFPDGTPPVYLAKAVPSLTNNEAEYDAVYEGLLSLVNTQNTPTYPVLVKSDSQLVVKQLTNEYEINHESLKKRYNSIHALCSKIPVPVRIEWRPRNSTPDLTQANFLAQDLLQVKRH